MAKLEGLTAAVSCPRQRGVAIFLCAALGVLGMWAPAVHAAPLFGALFQFAGGNISADRLAVGDLDHDGRPDLLAASRQRLGDVYWLRNTGSGSFGAPIDLGTASSLANLVLKDVDEDGAPDLVFSNAGVLTLWRGGADNGFPLRSVIDTGASPAWSTIQVADLDRDGHLDIVVGNQQSFTVGVLMGDGHGGFGSLQVVPAQVNAFSIAVGDVDGDGVPDLICGVNFSEHQLAIFHGLGNGSFRTPPTLLATHSVVDRVAIGDVTGDGIPDVVLSDATGVLSIFPGLGSGGLGARVDRSVGVYAYLLALQDYDGDGRMDMVWADQGWFALLSGAGATPPSITAKLPCVSNLTDLAMADVDGDGHPDMVAVDGYEILVYPFISNGGHAGQTDVPCNEVVTSLAVGDLDQDGSLDVVVAGRAANAIEVFKGSGTGLFKSVQRFATGSQPSDLKIADMDRDGTPDLVWAEAGENRVQIGYGDRSLLFGADRFLATALDPEALATGDLDGDGFPDIVTMHPGRYPGTLTILRHLAYGESPVRSDLALNHLGDPVIADLDHDHHADILIPFQLLRGDGAGGFVPFPSSPPMGDHVVLRDVDGDGYPDALGLGLYSQRNLQVNRGLADGAFLPPVEYPFGGKCLAVADLDGDGLLDVATGAGDGVHLFMGAGGGVFVPGESFGTGYAIHSIAAADFTGDSRVDLLVSNEVTISNYYANSTSPQSFTLFPNTGGRPLLGVPATPAAITRLAIRALRNPVHGVARLAYALPRAATVRLEVFDLAGRTIATLAQGATLPGAHEAAWDLRTSAGERARPGVYLAVLRAGDERASTRVVVLR
jgi:hypothetical protein